jgi:cellulose synthase/poly-beta-1,6-N-acetylglucosamine synthase-like glycosyltransferase
VVIGRNEGERLRRCLKSVFAMERDGFATEVFYVDSGSSDSSVTIATEMGAQAITLLTDHPTAARGRNAGWRKASGPIILFLDGDTVLHPRFVADSLADFTIAEVAVIWGHRREIHPERSVYNRVLDLDWIYKAGITLYCGGDALIRRQVLAATDGFNEELIAGEEPELCTRIRSLGYTVLHVDRPMTGHDLAITRWGQYWKRSTRAGHAFAEISRRSLANEGKFWVMESRGNFRRAIALMVLTILSVVSSVLLLSFIPLLFFVLFFALLSFRSAWKARWKTDDPLALLLYGMHSHVQQIPIFLGQVQYRFHWRKGVRASLLEYKELGQ